VDVRRRRIARFALHLVLAAELAFVAALGLDLAFPLRLPDARCARSPIATVCGVRR